MSLTRQQTVLLLLSLVVMEGQWLVKSLTRTLSPWSSSPRGTSPVAFIEAMQQGPGSGGGSKGGRTPSPAPLSGGNAGAAGGAAGGVMGLPVINAGRTQVVAAAPLEAPPKLCFELLKERNLKMKLADLGLSCEGDKKACVDRYTAFRNYVLSLKDSSSTMSLVQAAAVFTRQQRSIARAAARPQSLDASLAAAAAGKPGAGDCVTNGSTKAEGDVDLLIKDHSYAALIKQTRPKPSFASIGPELIRALGLLDVICFKPIWSQISVVSPYTAFPDTN
eukprot:gene5230-5466_t